MKRSAWRARPVFLVIALAIVTSFLLPGGRSTVALSAMIVLFGVVAAQVAARIGASTPDGSTAFDRFSAERAERPQRPPDLAALERTLSWRHYSAQDFDYRVRPLLRRLIAHKLLASRGIDLVGQPAAARRALGVGLTWVIEGAPASMDESAMTTARIARILDEIEML